MMRWFIKRCLEMLGKVEAHYDYAAFGAVIAQTLPKKPKSPLERYRLLRKGKDVLA